MRDRYRAYGWGTSRTAGDWALNALLGLIAVAVVTVLAVAIFVACNPAEPKSGRVVGRPHYAAWVQIMTSCTKYGCTIIPISHPERWELCVIPDEHEGDFAEQHCFGVGQTTWDRTALGSHYYVEDGTQ